MAKKRIIELPEQKGFIQIKGIVNGVKSGKFFETKMDYKGRPRNNIKFGVSVSEDSTIYVENSELKQENVYFFKKAEVKGQKGDTIAVPYAQYKTFNREGYSLLGMKNGLEKELNEKGEEKNKMVTLPNFDAVQYMAKTLEDGMSVYINGSLDFSSYVNQKGEKQRTTRYVPSSVFLAGEVDFHAEGYKPLSTFRQQFVFMGIEKDDSDKKDVKYIVSGLVVKYSTIENVEFVIYDRTLANSFERYLKPYTALTAWGEINNKVIAEEIDEFETAMWGVADPSKKNKKSKQFVRELIITGVDSNSFDSETYSEREVTAAYKAIEEAKKVHESFGETTDPTFETNEKPQWGSEEVKFESPSVETFEDDDWAF